MLNRRHLRIKVLQVLYAYYQSRDDDYKSIEKTLMHSIERMYDLYIYLFLTFSELKHISMDRMEENKKKIRPSENDLNPNTKFIHNQVIQAIEACATLRKVSEQRKVNWIGDENRELFRKMFLHIRDSEVYNSFMNNGRSGFEEDKEFAISLFKTEIANFPLLYGFFEEENIHWLDDIDLMCNMVIKTIKALSENEELEVFSLYKPEDDEQEFVKTLLSKTLVLDAENEALIDDLTRNWELDRIAKMDVILMKMALTELQVFSNIPSSVTLNEYIEIAKFYSTPKSNGFINGILDKAIIRLQKENKMHKIGRGLMK